MKTIHPHHNPIRFVGSFALLAVMLLLPGSAFANAFFIQELGGDGMGMGGASVAAGDRPMTQFHNASNLSFIEDMHLQAGLTLYKAVGNYESPEGQKTNMADRTIPVPFFGFSIKPLDWLAIGIMECTNFGLATEWPKNWAGSHLVIKSEMQSFNINPNISFGPFKGFAFAIGFDAVYGQIDIKRRLTLGLNPPGDENADNTLALHGSAWGYGANVGLMYQPHEMVRFGVAYRSAVEMKLDNGKADFEVNSAFASRFPDQHFKSSITLPHLLSMGIRVMPLKTLAIELDAWATFWSSYDKLDFKFDKGLELGPSSRINRQIEKKEFYEAAQIRLGADWKFYDKYALRLGLIYDGNPIPDKTLDPLVPDNHRINFTIGLGGEWHGFYADAAYMLVYAIPREVKGTATATEYTGNTFPGRYSWIAHDISLSIGFHYDVMGRNAEKAAETIQKDKADIQAPASEPAPAAEPTPAPVPQTEPVPAPAT